MTDRPARGLFQFVESTWQSYSESRGINYGFEIEGAEDE